MTLAVMGCIVNGPGESRHANIGISRRARAKHRGVCRWREEGDLRGDNIAQEFVALIDDYVEHTYVRSAG